MGEVAGGGEAVSAHACSHAHAHIHTSTHACEGQMASSGIVLSSRVVPRMLSTLCLRQDLSQWRASPDRLD